MRVVHERNRPPFNGAGRGRKLGVEVEQCRARAQLPFFTPEKATLIRDTRMATDWYEAEATCDSKDIVPEMGGQVNGEVAASKDSQGSRLAKYRATASDNFTNNRGTALTKSPSDL